MFATLLEWKMLLEKYELDCMYSPSTKILYVLTFSAYLFGAVSQNYLRCCFPGCSLHFPPNNTELSTLTLFLFFQVNRRKSGRGAAKRSLGVPVLSFHMRLLITQMCTVCKNSSSCVYFSSPILYLNGKLKRIVVNW